MALADQARARFPARARSIVSSASDSAERSARGIGPFAAAAGVVAGAATVGVVAVRVVGARRRLLGVAAASGRERSEAQCRHQQRLRSSTLHHAVPHQRSGRVNRTPGVARALRHATNA